MASFMHYGFAGLTAWQNYRTYKERVANGDNALVAAVQEAGSAYLFTAMGPIPALIASDALHGFAVTRAIGKAAYNTYVQQRTWQRQIRTPFSHRFEHSDATMMAQQRGMQALGMSTNYVGSEAAMMARRYSRR